jgi:uncharacterized repeat protein (TIGR03837 family)
MTWDLYCRVIDNLGDIGVCWRLAADLAGRGYRVRLWTDDASALAWMAPGRAPGVEVNAWPDVASDPPAPPGEVVIEAFGCRLPEHVVQAMAKAQQHPVWINLEYLSAEAWVERSHRLPSPQPEGLSKWFFFPGFAPATGGLLREPDLMSRAAEFNAVAWLEAHAGSRHPGERLVSLFCYDRANGHALVERFGDEATLLLVAPGPGARLVRELLGPTLQRGALRAVMLPWLSQLEFDHLLWACDLNFVRGEDSFVRAQWAGRPFVWQPYPQSDGVEVQKRDAFLDRHLSAAPSPLAAQIRSLWVAWDAPSQPFPALPCLADWSVHALRWRAELLQQTDLTTQLIDFAREKG